MVSVSSGQAEKSTTNLRRKKKNRVLNKM